MDHIPSLRPSHVAIDPVGLNKPDRDVEPSGFLNEAEHALSLAGSSAVYGAIEMPADAMTQIVNRVDGKNILPNLNLVDTPPQTKFGSLDWFSEMAGEGVGMWASFMAASYGTKLLLDSAGASLANMPALEGLVPESIDTAAPYIRDGISGAIYGGLFIPSSSTDSSSFWLQRAEGAALGAGAMEIQDVSTNLFQAGLKKAGLSVAESAPVAAKITQNLGANIVGGTVAGVAGAEAASLLGRDSLASGNEVAANVLQNVIVPV